MPLNTIYSAHFRILLPYIKAIHTLLIHRVIQNIGVIVRSKYKVVSQKTVLQIRIMLSWCQQKKTKKSYLYWKEDCWIISRDVLIKGFWNDPFGTSWSHIWKIEICFLEQDLKNCYRLLTIFFLIFHIVKKKKKHQNYKCARNRNGRQPKILNAA